MRVVLLTPESGLDPALSGALEGAVREAGHEPLPAPPSYHPGVSASERNHFLTLVDQLLEADILVAEASAESATLGWCAAWLLAKGRLVVLACRADARASLSPMLAGNPSPWQRLVLYRDADELRAKLAETLRF